jgi:hypothetical protein
MFSDQFAFFEKKGVNLQFLKDYSGQFKIFET